MRREPTAAAVGPELAAAPAAGLVDGSGVDPPPHAASARTPTTAPAREVRSFDRWNFRIRADLPFFVDVPVPRTFSDDKSAPSTGQASLDTTTSRAISAKSNSH